jgi:membrane-associated phospholipid phosphatase
MVIELRLRAAPQYRHMVIASLICLAAIGLSIAFIDRPAATWSHEVLHRPRWCVWFTWLPEPLDPLAALILVAAGIWRATGRRFTPFWRTALAAAAATLVATIAVMALKNGFGRMWPETWVQNNPSWITDHRFGFLPFHGGRGYESFPSGHTTRTAAPFAVLWARLPHWRALWVMPMLVVVIGLLGADFHFVSDCIAGAWVGAMCAWITLRFI